MLIEQNHVTVSSDIGGITANPIDVQEFYRTAGVDSVGIELVAMPLQLSYLNSIVRNHRLDFRLDGVHVQLGRSKRAADHEKGFLDWALIGVADKLIRKTFEELVHPFPLARANEVLPLGLLVEMAGCNFNHDIYLNAHYHAVANQLPEYEKYVHNFNHFSHLTIENGPGRGESNLTLDLVSRFKDLGYGQVVATLDLVHSIVEWSGGAVPDINQVVKHWSKLIQLLEFNRNLIGHLHFPIGLRADDSLPISQIVEQGSMLRDLGQVIRSTNLPVTIENQHSLLFGARRKRELERLKWLRDIFLDTEIIGSN